MNTKKYVVRIIKPSSDPHMPKIERRALRKKNYFLSRKMNVLAGSVIGFAAGVVIFLMLKLFGINYGGLESTLIIGLPALLGLITSYAVS